MRILYILRAGYGAAGEAASFQYASVMNRDNDVLVLESIGSNQVETIVSTDSDVDVVNIYAASMSEQICNVYKQIKFFQPDIIHIMHSPYCFYYVYRLKKLFSKEKWIVDFRSPHVGSVYSPARKKYFLLQFYADRLITHSLASLKTNIIFKLFPVDVVPPGISLASFKDCRFKSDLVKPKRFIFIGSISETRKIDFLVTSFGMYASNSNLDLRLDIYGHGNGYSDVKKLIDAKKLSKWVVLKGVLPQKELFDIIPNYDVGIAYVPYEFFNSAPSLKSLEYVAAKIPVMASDTLGHKEYNSTYGFDFKLFKNTKQKFERALDDLCINGVAGDVVMKNHNAILKFDWQRLVGEKLKDVYVSLLN